MTPKQERILNWLQQNAPCTTMQLAEYTGTSKVRGCIRMKEFEKMGFVYPVNTPKPVRGYHKTWHLVP